ncbi:MAG: hypothetical protein EPN21_06560 [Methylococcaceae bacterium]|nr:MAG: hypothetical protein EPN21_06560 [Methylococcaceae bacterium]
MICAFAITSRQRWLIATFIASIILSAYKVGTGSTVNNDGLLYLHTAQVFVEQGIRAAFAQFNWPFFPVLIGLLHKTTGLGYESAAHALNALLLALLCVGFVTLYREMTASDERPWLAAAIIILSPQITNYRPYIIRDIGYWALALWALLYFARYCRRPSWHTALAWQSCILAAVAFRIEGAALAALLPLWCLRGGQGTAWSARLKTWLGANNLFLAGAGALLGLLISGAIPLPANSRLDQFSGFLSPLQFAAAFSHKAEAIAQHTQAFYAPQDAKLLLLGGGLYLFIHKAVSCLGIIYALPLGWALLNKPRALAAFSLIGYAAAITAIPLLAFTYKDLFLSGRYMGLLVFLLSLPVACAVNHFMDSRRSARSYPYWLGAMILAGLFLLADIFIQTGPSKRYLREGANWLQQTLPAGTALCSEDGDLLYYAGRGYSKDHCPALTLLAQPEAANYGAFLIKIHHKDKTKMDQLQAILASHNDWGILKEFGNAAGDKLFIVTHLQPAP